MRDFNDDREQEDFLRRYNEEHYERRKKMRKRVKRVKTIAELILSISVIGTIVMAILSLVLK